MKRTRLPVSKGWQIGKNRETCAEKSGKEERILERRGERLSGQERTAARQFALAGAGGLLPSGGKKKIR